VVEISISDWHVDPCSAVESAASLHGMSISTNGSLKSVPGSRHWHLKKPPSSGTLEFTFWPEKELFWVSYHSNRTGDGWVSLAAEAMADELARVLGGKRGAATEK